VAAITIPGTTGPVDITPAGTIPVAIIQAVAAAITTATEPA
jgi:hypothetical protein